MRTPIKFALAAILMIGCGASQNEPTTATSSGDGVRPADFALEDIDGKRVHLSDFLGEKVILINFWATWCKPCAGEMPHLQRLYETYEKEGLVVLAVSMDGPESIAEVSPFARRHGLTFPVLLDHETRVVGMLNPKRSAPFNLLIAKNGTIVMSKESYSAGDEVEIEEHIRAHLK